MPAPCIHELVLSKDPADKELTIKPIKAPKGPPEGKVATGEPEMSGTASDTPLAEQANIWKQAPDTGEELTAAQRRKQLRQLARIDRKRRAILKKGNPDNPSASKATAEDKRAFWNMEPVSPTSDLSNQGAEGVPSKTGNQEDPLKGKSPKEEKKD